MLQDWLLELLQEMLHEVYVKALLQDMLYEKVQEMLLELLQEMVYEMHVKAMPQEMLHKLLQEMLQEMLLEVSSISYKFQIISYKYQATRGHCTASLLDQ